MKIPTLEELLLNEYNQALRLRNLNKSRIMTFRGLSIGTSFTLLATILTAPILAIGVYSLIVVLISGLIISLFFIEFRLIFKLERIDNYCNYLQIVMRDQKKESTNDFIPLSFIFNYLKKEDINLLKVKEKYNSAKLELFLVQKPIEFKKWIVESYNILRFIILIIIVITIIFISIIGVSTGSEMGVSWFDAYSLAHLGFGIFLFLLLSLTYTFPKRVSQKPWMSILSIFLLTILMLILWEVIENTLFIAVGIKPRLDTLENVTSDLIFGILGAGIQLILFNIFYEEKKKKMVYYGIGILCSITYLLYLFVIVITTNGITPF